MHTLELAKADEAELCNQIIREGRQFQRKQGFVQWTEDHPNIDTIRGDVADGTGYVLRVEGVTAGYMCIDFSGVAAYAAIEGTWGPNSPTPWCTAWLSAKISGEWDWWTPPLR